ncbi:MAG: hypothetical protein AB1847_13580 [bacterium]
MSYHKKNRVIFGNIIFFFALFLIFSKDAPVTSLAWGQLTEEQPAGKAGRWMAGDFHQHTLYTDGSFSMSQVISNGFLFGLDWQANAEHGGTSERNENKVYWDDPGLNTTFLGDPVFKDDHRLMWRWQNLRDYAYPQVLALRTANPDKLIALGLEWNIPGHEHCLVGIVADDGKTISEFEYLFDRLDRDTSRNLPKQNGEKDHGIGIFGHSERAHIDALSAAVWLKANCQYTSWLIPSHPERLRSYDIAHLRDLNNTAPDVAFGFEGIPGHQKSKIRGEYSIQSNGGATYGGAGCYAAKVGGLWDALLGEGRVFSTFANSDFHTASNSFWPGEYAKNYTFVQDRNGDGQYSLEELVHGLRSGNTFCVTGDLIDALDFRVQSGDMSACMGQTLHLAKGDKLRITIRFKSPKINHHGDPVRVDHLDLISGEVTGRVDPSDKKAYHKDTNQSTRVLARFTKQDWREDDGRWQIIEYTLENVEKDGYFRLRGTNLAPGTTGETDMDGNPLPDAAFLLGSNDGETAWRDLWFYSNAIFVNVHQSPFQRHPPLPLS